MILYLDTSALVKKYFRENDSDKVISQWRKARAVATSSIAYAEALASFFRKKREVNISANVFDAVLASFREDWKSLICVRVNDDLNDIIDKILSHHPLRGFDSIHLASALILHDSLAEEFLFGCFDKRLVQAAVAEGLRPLT
jgi:predicted nucleic acid-binding protein